MVKFKKKKIFLVMAIILGLLVILYSFGVLRPVESLWLFFSKPLARSFYSWGTDWHRSYNERRSQVELIDQVAALTKEVTRLTVESARRQELETENNKLRSQLNFFSNQSYRPVVANIIAKESVPTLNEQSQDIVIDKGRTAGLRVGLGVISEEGVIIGKITEVRDNTAKLCLTTSSGCQLAAALQNIDKTQGITDGDLGLTIKMDYIPQPEKVAVGDIVVTSGLGASIPRGLVIGTVSAVRSEKNEVWQDATIEPISDFNNLTVVSVVIP